MPKKKQLKINGSLITVFKVQVRSVKSNFADQFIDIVDLQISTGNDLYQYDIRTDQRFTDLKKIRDSIESTLIKAKKDSLKVIISEDKDRGYLFMDVQKDEPYQYSGCRV